MFNTNCHELSINYSLITVSIMNKKAYQQPTMNVVKLQHKSHILVNSVQTKGLGSESLGYDRNGGDQGDAWSRDHRSVWDDEEEDY